MFSSSPTSVSSGTSSLIGNCSFISSDVNCLSRSIFTINLDLFSGPPHKSPFLRISARSQKESWSRRFSGILKTPPGGAVSSPLESCCEINGESESPVWSPAQVSSYSNCTAERLFLFFTTLYADELLLLITLCPLVCLGR